MQISCSNCHKPFALPKAVMIEALDEMKKEKLPHYNAHCPHCRRANRLGFKDMKRRAPYWKPKEEASDSDE